MIFDGETPAPCAVIDWDMGTRGDPLRDLAVLLSFWPTPGIPSACIICGRCRPRHPVWCCHEIIDAYRHLSGRTIGDFGFYQVLALLRSAIVLL
jgi:aminoglycoside phosphotransferase (APT) family kinase protein